MRALRAYTFTNFYLNSVAQGIQPAHCLVDMVMHYNARFPDAVATDVLNEWANKHKTMICLNGGNHRGILDVWEKIEHLGNHCGLPVGKFHEDEDSLGGLMTCCGIVVPEQIFATSAALRRGETEVMADGASYSISRILDDYEMELAILLNGYGLAK
jgi:hypothetical protein